MLTKIDRILVEEQFAHIPLVEKITSAAPKAVVSYLNKGLLDQELGYLSWQEGKSTIAVTSLPGSKLKTCPGMKPFYCCCRLYVASPIFNCPIHCSYCFLQYYLNQPAIIIDPRIDLLCQEISSSAKQIGRTIRITTGEFSDSLALDKVLGISKRLIKLARSHPNLVLELKTKTTEVNHLLDGTPNKNVIFSWSLNPWTIARREESGAASTQKRLEVASQVQKAGYLTAFHFDPLISYPNWQKDYLNLLTKMFSLINPDKIAWISLGSLRFPAKMERYFKENNQESKLFFSEFVTAADGKRRYLKSVRYQLYRQMVSWIKDLAGQTLFIYLCMELPEAWKNVFDFQPQNSTELDYWFAKSLYDKFSIGSRKPQLKDFYEHEVP
jgi:spore photoproduct lyase